MHMAHVTPAPFGANDETNVVGLCPSHHRQWDAQRAGRSREFGVFDAGAARQAADLGKQTPPVEDRSTPVLAPSHGQRKVSAVLQVSGGVGAGSPALPAGFAGVWGGCGPIPDEYPEGAEPAKHPRNENSSEGANE